jgi:hypothetical protein
MNRDTNHSDESISGAIENVIDIPQDLITALRELIKVHPEVIDIIDSVVYPSDIKEPIEN